MMDYAEIYSEGDEDYQPTITTNEESYRESVVEPKYKKWISSNTDISHISSIYRLELESSNGKKADILNQNKKIEKNYEDENEQEEKSEKENEEENDVENYSEEKLKEEKIEENNSEETFEDSNNILKNYTFIWNEGGNDVKLTGSFSDWKIQFQMIKDPDTNIFKYELPLGNEIYQYKFIVDGEWKFSKNFPIEADGDGNINNILDNRNNLLVQPKEKKDEEIKEKAPKEKPKKSKKIKKNKESGKTKTKKSRLSTKTKTTKTRASTINKEKMIRKNSIYQSVYPSDDDIIPLPLPNKRYYQTFKLEDFTNQKAIGNIKYYDYYDRYCFSFEASSRPIFILGHINLNHLISVKNNKSNILKNSMSFRYREKASTFIYYKYN